MSGVRENESDQSLSLDVDYHFNPIAILPSPKTTKRSSSSTETVNTTRLNEGLANKDDVGHISIQS